MTKDELNKREVERAKEMQQLHTMIDAKDLAKVLSLINKYPEAILSEQETQQLSLLAAQTGSVELLQICLELYKWDLNAHLNFEQQTVLHVATKNNFTDFAILIVNKGGNFSQEDAFGKTAVDYAKSKEMKAFYKNLTSKKKNK
jgi:ankyrin repeat protein